MDGWMEVLFDLARFRVLRGKTLVVGGWNLSHRKNKNVKSATICRHVLLIFFRMCQAFRAAQRKSQGSWVNLPASLLSTPGKTISLLCLSARRPYSTYTLHYWPSVETQMHLWSGVYDSALSCLFCSGARLLNAHETPIVCIHLTLTCACL